MGFKDRAKQRVKQLSEGDRFKLAEGENFLRVLPTPESEEGAEDDIIYEMLVHYGLGSDGKGIRRCGHSPTDRSEGECYICDVYIPKLIRQGKGESAKKLKSRWACVLQVLKGVEDGDKLRISGPFVFMTGRSLGKNIMTLMSAGRREMYSQDKGFWFTVVRTGSGLDTEYSAPIPDDEPTKIPAKYVEMLKPFVQLSEIEHYDEQAQRDAILGNKPSDSAASPSSSTRGKRSVMDDSEDEDEAPKKPAKAPAKRVAEDADDEDEDAPPAKPAKTGKAAKPPVEPDDEETEDEDADEVEETPAPKKPAKTTAAPAKATPAKSTKRPDPEPEDDEDADEDVDDADEDVDDADEDEAPPPPKKTAAKTTVKVAAKAPAKSTKKPPVEPEDDEDDPFED